MDKPSAASLVAKYELAAYIDIDEFSNEAEWAVIIEALRCYTECPIDKSACSESTRRLKGLQELCGHWQDGSQTQIVLDQDDATRSFILRAGKKTYYDSSFYQVIDAAIADAPPA